MFIIIADLVDHATPKKFAKLVIYSEIKKTFKVVILMVKFITINLKKKSHKLT